jgi:hypothetical protein
VIPRSLCSLPRLLPFVVGLTFGLASCATAVDAAPRQKPEPKAAPASGGKKGASQDGAGAKGEAARGGDAKGSADAKTGGAKGGASEAKDMTPKQWQAAEQTLRAHFTKHSRPLLEVAAEDKPTLGAVFWVRYKAGGGGLVLVRGGEVFAERGAATIRAILKADQQLTSHAIGADDFLYLLQNLGELPTLPADPFTEFRVAELNPAWSFGKDEARFVVHSPNSRKAGPGGGPQREQIPVVRATLTVSADYSLRWSVEELTYSAPGK